MSFASNLLIGSKVLFPILILGLVAVIIWWVFSTNEDLAIGLIVGLIPSLITLYQRKKEREEDYKNWLMQNKEACYIELATILMSTFASETKRQRLITKFNRLKPALVVWGSPSILLEYERMQNLHGKVSRDESIKFGERIFRALRKNLGHDDQNLKSGLLWATLILPEIKDQVYEACKGETYDDL